MRNVDPGAPQSSILTVYAIVHAKPGVIIRPRAVTIPLRIAAQPIQLIEHSQLDIRPHKEAYGLRVSDFREIFFRFLHELSEGDLSRDRTPALKTTWRLH
jgi:hypothetical protein